MPLSKEERERLEKLAEELQKILNKDKEEKEPDNFVDYGSRERREW